jgi:outer membrane protein TolC
MDSNLKTWPLVCGLAVAVGCARFQPQPLAPEKSAAQFDARRLDDPGLKTFLAENAGGAPAPWPVASWDLNSLTLAAFYFHPDLAVARAQWRVAQAGVLAAGARPNPSVSLSPSYDTQIPGNYSPWLIPVTFDLPLETAGKRGKRVAEAEKAAESARWSFVAAAWQIRSGVRASLLEFSLAGRRAELLQKQFAAQTEIVTLLQGRFDAGAVARPEVALAQVAWHKTQLDLSDARSKQADARSRLAQAVGVSLAALDGVQLEFNDKSRENEGLNASEARSVALRERADIRGALADYAAAEADLRLQVAKQYPDLHLGPGYAWNNGNAGDNQWILGATLELPILDQNRGPIAQAAAQCKLAAAKFAALQAQVCGQIDRALALVRVAREQLRTADQLLAAEQQQEQSAQAQLRAGASDRLELLNVQLASANAGLTRLDNEEKLQSALGMLEDALQQPADSLGSAIQRISSNQ